MFPFKGKVRHTEFTQDKLKTNLFIRAVKKNLLLFFISLVSITVDYINTLSSKIRFKREVILLLACCVWSSWWVFGEWPRKQFKLVKVLNEDKELGENQMCVRSVSWASGFKEKPVQSLSFMQFREQNKNSWLTCVVWIKINRYSMYSLWRLFKVHLNNLKKVIFFKA